MAVKVYSSTYAGINGVFVNVEVDITRGLPSFNIVGLADTAVKESKERVRSAIINSGYDFPVKRITINLAPANLKKEGSQFDLPIAIGILHATNQINCNNIHDYIIVGELSLLGELKAIKGALPSIIEGKKNGISNYIVPLSNAKECSIIEDINVFVFSNLKAVVDYLTDKTYEAAFHLNKIKPSEENIIGFEDVVGQESCKRAIEVASSGGHNLLMFGPPGCGKTMIAERIPTILPELSKEEAMEVTQIYSIFGSSYTSDGIITRRPFRNPHHTCSTISLVGGGRNLLPGEISLAHGGVLFLDEMLEFNKSVLEVLRQPLEDRCVRITRTGGTVRYPASIMLVGALNPCPCGYYGSSVKDCTCTSGERSKYISKLSGPLLDRIDIFTSVNSLGYSEIKNNKNNESSQVIRCRVEKARKIQNERFKREKILYNSQMNQKQINKYCKIDNKINNLLEKVFERYKLSTRAYSRILKVSRTIADLSGREMIEEIDIIESLQYRKFINENII